MITRKTLAILLLTGAVGVGAYAAGVATRPATVPAQPDNATEAMLNWLQVPANQQDEIRQHDPNFAGDLKSLRAVLAVNRTDLATALDDPKASDDAIRGKVDAVVAANAQLQRRVVDYLLSVRHHLSADQQRRLFGLCAEGVRRGPNCWGQNSDAAGPAQGAGRGFGPGGRFGRGRGGQGS